MKKRLTMILASLLFVVTGAFAQMQVSGTVISQDDNQPVAGATVQVVGASNVGTVTDLNGKFSLTVPAGRKNLRISYVGMEPIEVSARSNRLLPWIARRLNHVL